MPIPMEMVCKIQVNPIYPMSIWSSCRVKGSGDDDLYFFKQIQKPITGCKQRIRGYITDPNKKLNISKAKVTLLNDKLEEVFETQTDAEGMYEFEADCNESYIVRVVVSGYDSKENQIQTGKQFEEKHEVDFAMQKGGELGKKTVSYGEDMGFILDLEPIYFDFNKSDIRPDAVIELQKMVFVMKKHPKLKIDIRSHTDSRGETDYNLNLSNDRAQSTRQYIISQGIVANRISGIGLGDRQIINQCVKGVTCTEEEHALNRRSEFIVVNKDFMNDSIQVKVEKISVTTDDKKPKADSSVTQSSYDFQSKEVVYTVQVGAFMNQNALFPSEINVYFHLYKDGMYRYFSGVFDSREKAVQHKIKLAKLNIEGFVAQLQGENRK